MRDGAGAGLRAWSKAKADFLQRQGKADPGVMGLESRRMRTKLNRWKMK